MIPGMLLLAVLFTVAGIGLGIFTGLIPGIHVNTLAILLMVSAPVALGIAASTAEYLSLPASTAPALMSCLIVGNLITHSFLDFIPSALFGAPDEETALSVIPSHRMIMEGRGMGAIKLSAGGSIRAVLMSLVLLFPAYIFFSPLGGYSMISPYMAYFLMLISAILIFSEMKKGIKMYCSRDVQKKLIPAIKNKSKFREELNKFTLLFSRNFNLKENKIEYENKEIEEIREAFRKINVNLVINSKKMQDLKKENKKVFEKVFSYFFSEQYNIDDIPSSYYKKKIKKERDKEKRLILIRDMLGALTDKGLIKIYRRIKKNG
jgi:hypothetical protein